MSGAMHFWELIIGTVIALLQLINPLAATPAFLAITEGDSEERRREQALKGCLYMVGILVAFLIGGTFIMNFFGLSLPGMRIAGGLLVAGIGASMLSPPAGRAGPDDRETAAARAKRDISFTPLAMPTLSGPGSIAVTLGLQLARPRPARLWGDYSRDSFRGRGDLHRPTALGPHREGDRRKRHVGAHAHHGFPTALRRRAVRGERRARRRHGSRPAAKHPRHARHLIPRRRRSVLSRHARAAGTAHQDQLLFRIDSVEDNAPVVVE